MPRCREAAISGAAKLISFMPDPSSSARLPCRAGRYDTGQLRNPPLRQRRWRRERGSNRRSLRERVGPLRPKGNAVVAKRGSLVSTVSDAGDRGFESISLQRGARCELDPPLDEDSAPRLAETIEMLTGNVEKIAEHGRRADGIVKSGQCRQHRHSGLHVRQPDPA